MRMNFWGYLKLSSLDSPFSPQQKNQESKRYQRLSIQVYLQI